MVDFFLRAHLIYKAGSKAGDYHGQMNAKNFVKWRTKKRTSNFPTQLVKIIFPVTVSPQSTCIVKICIIWLGRKGIVSDETLSKKTYQLILSQKPKEISTKLIAYWLIMIMQSTYLHTCDLNL